MKIIILSLVTVVLFVGCGSKNVSTIPESSARFLRKSNSQLIQVTDKTQLEMDDYVLFTTNTNKSISVEDIETKSQSPYTVASYSECKIMNKKFSYENHLTQNAIQLKSILPLEFFLSSNNSATCSFKITLQKDGSSKTFNFMGTTIKNINSSSEILLGNEKAEQLMTSPESILEKDLDHFTIAHTNKNDYVSLICENFRTEPVKIELDILKLGNVARLTRAISYAPYEIDPRSYIPNQDCVIHLKKENGIALLSPTFQMKFTVASH
jgi:hypothetical protein